MRVKLQSKSADMSLLRDILTYATDPEVVAGFQKRCGIIYSPDQGKDGEVNRHQNGISSGAVLNGKSTPVNGVHRKENGLDDLNCRKHTVSDTETHTKLRNGVTMNGGDKMEVKPAANGVIRTGTVPFRIENKLLYYLFCFGAQLGNAAFYITFYSFSFWNFDSYVTRRICLVWCICMYFGQATKDIVRLPRPKSPPVVRLETRYELEYGMPSTHAIVATAIPFSMLIFTSGRYQYPMAVGVVIAVAWCILVCLSRIYLGMHNILDVVVGLLFAVVVMTFTVPYVDVLDTFLVTNPLAPFVILSFPIIFTLLYPSLDKWSTCRGDTTLILSITGGLFLGSWLNHCQGFMSPNDASMPFSLDIGYKSLIHGTLRLLLGVALTVLALYATKTVIYKSLCAILKMNPKDPKTKQQFVVELPYKYLTYVFTSLHTVYTAPLLFCALGIQRMSYYTEI